MVLWGRLLLQIIRIPPDRNLTEYLANHATFKKFVWGAYNAPRKAVRAITNSEDSDSDDDLPKQNLIKKKQKLLPTSKNKKDKT